MAKESVSYTINESIAVLSTTEAGWTKELNMITWGENIPKYDIRSWSPDHSKMTKGITLSAEELFKLIDAMQSRTE